jgi:hypothetical protein
MIRHALDRNGLEDPGQPCAHICVELYENPWLAGAGARLIRQPVEMLIRRRDGG